MSKNNKKNIESGNEKGKGSKAVLIGVGVIVLLALVAGAVFVGYLVASKNVPTSAGVSSNTSQQVKIEEFSFEVKEFIVNLKDENKDKFLKIKVYLGGDSENKKLKAELESYKPQIEDSINKILRSKVSTDFTVEGEAQLKNEIKTSINSLLVKGQVTNVYFTDLIIQ